MTSKSKKYAKYLYKLIDKNILLFENFAYTEFQEYPLNLEKLDYYKSHNFSLRKCFNFIKDFYSNYTYISHKQTKKILLNNVYNINEFLTKYSFTPIIILPNDSIRKSNLFFTLYFMYLYREIFDIIEHVFSSIYSSEDSLFTYSLSSYFYKNWNMNINMNILGIICDDFLYSGTQLFQHLHQFSYSNRKVKISTPDKFKFYINCIGSTKYAFDKIKQGFKEGNILISDTKYIKLPLSINDIIETKYRKPIHNKTYSNMNILRDLIFENDIFILVKINEEIQIKSILEPFYNLLKQSEIDRKTMTYLFCKYPDYASTFDILCGFNLFMNTEDYYIINKIKNHMIFYNSYIKNNKKTNFKIAIKYINNSNFIHFINFNTKTVFTDSEIESLHTQWGNLESLNLINNNISFKQCIYNKSDEWYSLLDNCTYKDNTKFSTCTDYCFTPFYKELKWTNIDNTNININSRKTIFDFYKNNMNGGNKKNLKNSICKKK